MEPADATALERPLRLVTCLAAAICIPLNIAATVLSLEFQSRRWDPRVATAYCFIFIPLAVTFASATLSLHYMKKHGKTSRAWHFVVLDLVAATGYFGTMITCWALEIREYNDGWFGLLTGYLTAPMILNMFIHMYFVLKLVPWKKTFSLFISSKPSCQQCPNCRATFISDDAPPMTKKGYSLLRGEEYLDIEADPIQYRDSEDFLGEGAERAEQPEQGTAAKDNSKIKDTV
ncbi:uncharacterized protein M421DRAFT_78121 [Didymella exigua CBS 183.55]|uniref:Uncharacterized protein n=1 Tax=Didymella exigua CBS 183.55 TaxID=1150837 RepID=A0A6A5R5P3_9PLEO|nr:uncharacterized protein M421DRAFT_78121 [Didymella exigua CBS 183.55]KAF1922488.1 hypothetical protein M421DRAFT_78121 [Didymella exigua CBS 183.55]